MKVKNHTSLNLPLRFYCASIADESLPILFQPEMTHCLLLVHWFYLRRLLQQNDMCAGMDTGGHECGTQHPELFHAIPSDSLRKTDTDDNIIFCHLSHLFFLLCFLPSFQICPRFKCPDLSPLKDTITADSFLS